jgi:hypothetical protein
LDPDGTIVGMVDQYKEYLFVVLVILCGSQAQVVGRVLLQEMNLRSGTGRTLLWVATEKVGDNIFTTFHVGNGRTIFINN